MDIKYNEIGDIDISSGDIQYVSGTEQHKFTILLSNKGEIKQIPNVGVGIENYIFDENPSSLLREIRRQCERIGIKIEKVFIENNKIYIIGDYEDYNNS